MWVDDEVDPPSGGRKDGQIYLSQLPFSVTQEGVTLPGSGGVGGSILSPGCLKDFGT